MRFNEHALKQRRVSFWLVGLLLATALLNLSASAAPALSGASRIGAKAVTNGIGRGNFDLIKEGTVAPTDASCRARAVRPSPCYSPQEMRKGYGLTSLIASGYDGTGQTIVIIDSFGSPTIQQDLKQFDLDFGLPDPPSFKVLAPLGTVPFDPDVNGGEQLGWAEETTLDVEWAHAIAPGASIVLLTSPVAETEGVQGFPEFLALEKYAVNNNLGKIITQSYGATEETLFDAGGRDIVGKLEKFYQYARQKHVSVFASSGDEGSANVDNDGNFYPFPTVIYPASSPWNTAVGGTAINLDTTGTFLSEVVWNEPRGIATGGGISKLFNEPDYQKNNLGAESESALLNNKRGLPDISYNASTQTPVLVYISTPGLPAGYYRFGGTSASSPQWAGIAAILNQYAGYPLGFLNPALYRLGNSPAAASVYRDIVGGDNSTNGIPGYPANSGWDLTTGWGSPKGQSLVETLSKLVTPTEFNLFVTGNLNLTQNGSSFEGRVGVGGNAKIANANLGEDIVVGGDLNFSSGSVSGGNAVYGGNASLTGVSFSKGKALKIANPIALGTAQTYIENVGAAWGSKPANGSVNYQYGGLTLTGSNAGLNVFSVPGSQLSNSNFMQINCPAGSEVLINVTGATAKFQNIGISLNGPDTQKVVYNFPTATSLTIDGASVEGLVWAAKADVKFQNGNLNGSLVAKSLTGGGSFQYAPFLGQLPV